ncbi:MAG TPA: PTS sugar transporter subunit IIA [Sedimentisphaerales bacterium]|nr:PTS sugar transporter subunit IIA [Sedimentisphaerales bacterium]
MKLADFVCLDAIIPELKAHSRDDAIVELVTALDKAGKLGKNNCQKIIKAVVKRENQATTGMGKGIALPHVQHLVVKDVVAAVGQSSSGIDFTALDKQLVYSVILLVSPADNPDKHLQAMESIFRHLQSDRFRSFLRQSQTAEQIKDLLMEADANPVLKQ